MVDYNAFDLNGILDFFLKIVYLIIKFPIVVLRMIPDKVRFGLGVFLVLLSFWFLYRCYRSRKSEDYLHLRY